MIQIHLLDQGFIVVLLTPKIIFTGIPGDVDHPRKKTTFCEVVGVNMLPYLDKNIL